jgi:DNA ligase-1
MKRLADALDLARRRRSRIGKEEAIAGALSEIARDDDDGALATAARVASGRLLPVGDGRSLGTGWSILLDVVCALVGYEDETVLACARKTGELAEAFALLLGRVDGADARPGVGLREVAALADALAAEPGRVGKRALLEAALRRATPMEAKYLSKALGGGMRIGAQEGVVEGAIARAFGGEVRAAASLVTDVGDLAVLAHRQRLDEAHLVVGRPVAFMLATPVETIATAIDPAAHVVEDKIDGVRAQAHRTAEGRVTIFARGLDRVTDAFPEIVDALRAAPTEVVLDGEIVAITPDGRPRPFQALQPRLRRSRPTPADLVEARVALVAFDLLADGAGPLLALPWRERRERLEAFARYFEPPGAIRVNPAAPLPPHRAFEPALDAAFHQARARGHEGLVLKRADAPYEAGRRGHAWIKVKRAHATLDVVVVAAEEGHGRRAGVLSDYTFAVWRDDDAGGRELVPVGKAYSGLTDDEIEAMTRRLEGITVERRGGVRLVEPRIVIEVAFDGVQRSTRHVSGFALRFPRIVRLRDDKRPEDADRVATVQAMLEAQVATGHREHAAGRAAPAPAPRRRKSRAASPKKQLSLFGEDE